MRQTNLHLVLLLIFLYPSLESPAQQLPSSKAGIESLYLQAMHDHDRNDNNAAFNKLIRVKQAAIKQHLPTLQYRAAFYLYIYGKMGDDYNFNIDTLSQYLKKFESVQDYLSIGAARAYLSNVYRDMGDVQAEIKLLYASIDAYKQVNNTVGIAKNLQDISLLHYDQNDLKNARSTINKAIELFRQAGTRKDLVGGYNNLSIIFEKSGPIDSAIYYQKIALKLAKEEKFYRSVGLLLSNLGNNYSAIGEDKLAETTLLKALKLRDSINDRHGMAFTNVRLCYFYGKVNKPLKAIKYGKQGLAIAEDIPFVKAQRMAHGALSLAYAKLHNPAMELYHYRKEQELLDSLRNIDNARNITRAVMSYEFKTRQLLDSIANAQKQREQKYEYNKIITTQKNQRNIFLISGLAALVMALGLWNRLSFIRKTKAIIEKEKDRSENLLLNILPAEIAEELKEKGRAEARDFDMVSILFTDFVAFTQTSEKLSASELVAEINHCFEAFDHIIERYGIEKIKTIGDAYMAAGGIPVPTADSVKNTVLAALQMQAFISQRKIENNTAKKEAFEMRVGIHTGPVVAGIVGVKKFQYDIWGDTVNTASRMENAGEVGKVNISQATHEILKDESDFQFEPRGRIAVKGKGEMEMWFISLRSGREF